MSHSSSARNLIAHLAIASCFYMGAASADNVGGDSYWEAINQQAQETYDEVSENTGSGWNNVIDRVKEVREGLTGIQNRSMDEINRGFNEAGDAIQ